MVYEQGGRTVEEAMRMEDTGLKRGVTRDQNRGKRADTNETKRQPLNKACVRVERRSPKPVEEKKKREAGRRPALEAEQRRYL